MIKRILDALSQPLGRIGILIAGLAVLERGGLGNRTDPESATSNPSSSRTVCMWAWACSACSATPARCAVLPRASPRRPSAGAAISRSPCVARSCPSSPAT